MTRPRWDQWPDALRSAIQLMETAGIADRPWRFTGGSALASLYHHRYSRDADIFFTEPADMLAAQAAISERFGYSTKCSGTHSLKIFLPNQSHVDLVNVTPLTNLPVLPLSFDRRIVAREDPVEIIAKKIRFRGGEKNPRDIFDYAMISNLQDGQWQTAAVAAGYGGMESLRKALDEGPGDFIATARTEIAAVVDFDPLDVWRQAEAAINEAMAPVLWADLIRQQADQKRPYLDERVARAINRALKEDPEAHHVHDAIQALASLDEFSPDHAVTLLGDAGGRQKSAVIIERLREFSLPSQSAPTAAAAPAPARQKGHANIVQPKPRPRSRDKGGIGD